VLKNSAYYRNFLQHHTTHGAMEFVEASGLPEYLEALSNGTCHGVIERQSHIDYLQTGSFTQSDGAQKSDLCTRYRGMKLHHAESEAFEAGPLHYGVGFKGFNSSNTAFVEGYGTPSTSTSSSSSSSSVTVAIDARTQQLVEGLRNEKRMSYWLTKMVAEKQILESYQANVRQNGCFTKQPSSGELEKLGSNNMAGAFAIVILSALVAICFWLIELIRRWIYKRKLCNVLYAFQQLTIYGNQQNAFEGGAGSKATCSNDKPNVGFLVLYATDKAPTSTSRIRSEPGSISVARQPLAFKPSTNTLVLPQALQVFHQLSHRYQQAPEHHCLLDPKQKVEGAPEVLAIGLISDFKKVESVDGKDTSCTTLVDVNLLYGTFCTLEPEPVARKGKAEGKAGMGGEAEVKKAGDGVWAWMPRKGTLCVHSGTSSSATYCEKKDEGEDSQREAKKEPTLKIAETGEILHAHEKRNPRKTSPPLKGPPYSPDIIEDKSPPSPAAPLKDVITTQKLQPMDLAPAKYDVDVAPAKLKDVRWYAERNIDLEYVEDSHVHPMPLHRVLLRVLLGGLVGVLVGVTVGAVLGAVLGALVGILIGWTSGGVGAQVKALIAMPTRGAGDIVQVKPQHRGYSAANAMQDVRERRKDSRDSQDLGPAMVTKVVSLSFRHPNFDELSNLFLGWAKDDLWRPDEEREIFKGASAEHVGALRQRHGSEHLERIKHCKILCYNWPRLCKVVKKKWCEQTMTRDKMHSTVLRFMCKDFKLKELAGQWAEDGVFIQAIDQLTFSSNEEDFMQFAEQRERLEKVLARYFEIYLQRNEQLAKDNLNDDGNSCWALPLLGGVMGGVLGGLVGHAVTGIEGAVAGGLVGAFLSLLVALALHDSKHVCLQNTVAPAPTSKSAVVPAPTREIKADRLTNTFLGLKQFFLRPKSLKDRNFGTYICCNGQLCCCKPETSDLKERDLPTVPIAELGGFE
jgi:outer membrane lipoprotein SlyB